MKLPSTSDWGLMLLALFLAIVIYHALKTETVHSTTSSDDPAFFHR